MRNRIYAVTVIRFLSVMSLSSFLHLGITEAMQSESCAVKNKSLIRLVFE